MEGNKIAKNDRSRKNPWKFLIAASLFFFLVAAVTIYIDVSFIHSGQWKSFYQEVFQANGSLNSHEWNGVTGVSVYGQIIGGVLVWTVTSLIASFAFLAAGFHMKKK